MRCSSTSSPLTVGAAGCEADLPLGVTKRVHSIVYVVGFADNCGCGISGRFARSKAKPRAFRVGQRRGLVVGEGGGQDEVAAEEGTVLVLWLFPDVNEVCRALL